MQQFNILIYPTITTPLPLSDKSFLYSDLNFTEMLTMQIFYLICFVSWSLISFSEMPWSLLPVQVKHYNSKEWRTFDCCHSRLYHRSDATIDFLLSYFYLLHIHVGTCTCLLYTYVHIALPSTFVLTCNSLFMMFH